MMRPKRWQVIGYLIAIAVMWAMLSNADYTDARQRECSHRSNAKYLVTWDSNSDTCKKEPRNGTTTQNR